MHLIYRQSSHRPHVFPWGLMSVLVVVLSAGASARAAAADDEPIERQRVADALRKAVEYFTAEVATEGGYLWQYSADLSQREGEGRASESQVWVQPPGTPTVGAALLKVYRDTDDRFYLEAARRAGMCLVRGQLLSGGWDYRIYFDPKQRIKFAYRVETDSAEGRRNTSTLDDNTTQAALACLIGLDKALDGRDPAIHEAVAYGLDKLLAAQYPIGAWPQRFDGAPLTADCPVCEASYPVQWSRAWPRAKYHHCYTLNDNAIADVVNLMLLAADAYGEDRYLEAARRAGDFLILAQMPEPQPAWCQQYNLQMQPAWARKFEPPSITGGESQSAIRTLMQLYRHTGDRKYLKPIPRAIAYLQSVELPDGKLARFYELRTDRPLYFTKAYELTYSDADMPTHYCFKYSSGLAKLRRAYERLAAADPEQLREASRPVASRPRLSSRLIEQTRQVVEAQDDCGRWVERGWLRSFDEEEQSGRVISCRTFVKNIGVLGRYLAASDRSAD